eukprot:14512484-Alexandrium_andersonii.AAC.1
MKRMLPCLTEPHGCGLAAGMQQQSSRKAVERSMQAAAEQVLSECSEQNRFRPIPSECSERNRFQLI